MQSAIFPPAWDVGAWVSVAGQSPTVKMLVQINFYTWPFACSLLSN